MNNFEENKEFNESSGEGKNPISVSRLKEYGQKAYGPLINVVFKYQDELTPYLNALAKGLQGGEEALNKENSSEAEKYVSQFFREASNGLNEACQKLESKDVKAFSDYLSDVADRKPSIMFSTSYIAGLFFGRLGRHLASNKGKDLSSQRNSNTDTSFMTNEPPALDQSIH